MNSEEDYVITILEHTNWHKDSEKSPPTDYSCNICHPVSLEETSTQFQHFWTRWAQPRCGGKSYTLYTWQAFQSIVNRETINPVTVQRLARTIRY